MLLLCVVMTLLLLLRVCNELTGVIGSVGNVLESLFVVVSWNPKTTLNFPAAMSIAGAKAAVVSSRAATGLQ